MYATVSPKQERERDIYGSFEREPTLPREAHPGYVESYLDALAKVLALHTRKPDMSIEDICLMLVTGILRYHPCSKSIQSVRA